tara:strand:+ start:362 stop:787 length:426 start_codon:yes stop_codon:yes gene_type:complete
VFNEKTITLVYKFIMHDNNPLSPHLQIYKWHISSLLSITHRVVGVINFFALIIICFWTISLLLGEDNYKIVETILNTIFGKFLAISLCWTFSFQILNEIRHLAWDAGYGYDLNIAKITGIITLIGSLVLTILFYLIGRNLF